MKRFLFLDYNFHAIIAVMKMTLTRYWIIVFILIAIVISIYVVFSKILEVYVINSILDTHALNSI